jgi:hypothetical protein
VLYAFDLLILRGEDEPQKSRPLAARSYNRRLEENRVKDKPGEFLWD